MVLVAKSPFRNDRFMAVNAGFGGSSGERLFSVETVWTALISADRRGWRWQRQRRPV